MRVLVQRCSAGQVTVKEKLVGAVDLGLVLFVGLAQDDTDLVLQFMAKKIVALRIFPDQKDRFHNSILDLNGGILAVPQFTLFANARKGRRPEFFEAMAPQQAEQLFYRFCQLLNQSGVEKVAAGVFGAQMLVSVDNDGPVSILLDSKELM